MFWWGVWGLSVTIGIFHSHLYLSFLALVMMKD